MSPVTASMLRRARAAQLNFHQVAEVMKVVQECHHPTHRARPGPLPACPLLPLSSHTRVDMRTPTPTLILTQMQRMAVSLNRRSHSLDVCLPSATLGLVMLACVGNGPHSAAPWLHDLQDEQVNGTAREHHAATLV